MDRPRRAQVDGFRFDIMGHLMVSTMKAAQAALAALTPAQDGVDGGALYLYGEAWDFGEARALGWAVATCRPVRGCRLSQGVWREQAGALMQCASALCRSRPCAPCGSPYLNGSHPVA